MGFNIFDVTSITTIDQKIAEWFNSLSTDGWNWGNLILCVIAIFLTVILCSCVGFEREKRGRSAGLRTHLLVGVGSCIIMIISIYGFPAFGGTRDVARLAAQVVAGVGFLGAGAIMHTSGGGIKGLTTASTIWLVMAIGLACGSMNFVLAVLGTAVVMIVLVWFRSFERMATKKSPQVIVMVKADVPIISALHNSANKVECQITDLVTQMVVDGGVSYTRVTFKLNNESGNNLRTEEFVRLVHEQTHAVDIQILNHH